MTTKNDGVQSTVKEQVQNIVIHVTCQYNNILYKLKLRTGYAFVLRKTKGELVIYSIKYLCRILSPHFTIFNISNLITHFTKQKFSNFLLCTQCLNPSYKDVINYLSFKKTNRPVNS